ncbi:juvenile hormone esterase [Amyelois transitella]|uniref:juvenile hormone esterase n=1 Tax=Amyelois transitella TaxID=680683 RepID=UPI0029904BCA|nr:juvenile hormone esterase [Amyelois transitella]
MLARCVFVCLFVAVLGCRSNSHEKPGKTNGSPKTVSSEDPITMTPSGTIRGSWMRTRRGRQFQAYRGIRYAEPPVGELRFQPPKPILQYQGVVDASKEGPACPLPAPPTYYVDEDCLTINVYTPNNNSTKPLPVIFFIHAGGFYSMTGRSDLAGPHYLLDRDVVLVTINYRLATLGFLSTGDALAPGNNGMKDQVVALRWVQKNIRAFGGDPGLITITGCSAGSISVMLHMVSPMSKGLFHRGISMSASPTGKESSRYDMYDLAVKQAEILNCPSNSSAAIISCLRTKSFKELGDSLPKFFDQFGFDPVGLWMPVVEREFGQERFLVKDPAESIKAGEMYAVPHMISQTTDEFFWKAFPVLKNQTLLDTMNNEWERVAPISFQMSPNISSENKLKLRQAYFGDKTLANDDVSTKALGRLYGDSIIGFPVHVMANLMCRHSPQKVFYYEFAHVGNHSHYEAPTTKKPVGAAHHDDLIYLFTLSYRFPTIEVSDTLDSKLVDKMTAIWYNFAKYGDPNPVNASQPELSNLRWPPMTSDVRQYLRIGGDFSVHEKMFENRFKVWEEIYPQDY